MWLQRMVGDATYENVKSGAMFQATFFNAYVESFMDNVLMNGAVFGEVVWAGATVEWCLEGTSHLHLIAALDKMTAASMQECLENPHTIRNTEEWLGKLFCEVSEH